MTTGLAYPVRTRLVQHAKHVGSDPNVNLAWSDYPSLLALPRPRIKAYHPETAIAEKLHAMVVLSEGNSRMKDFFDVFTLTSRKSFEGSVLSAAIAITFARRATEVPGEPPDTSPASTSKHRHVPHFPRMRRAPLPHPAHPRLHRTVGYDSRRLRPERCHCPHLAISV